ncbi:Senescence regulator S40 [Dillenia turbinata]|uniref:Senescence regulator S40 n=1 Tax=Dillenia turbinata TaxID=194707 RepID=A0AAN8WB20_9MAGN
METATRVGNSRDRRLPSADRFLFILSHSPPQNSTGISSSTSTINSDELNEDDVFWTGDGFTESASETVNKNKSSSSFNEHSRLGFSKPEGIRAALPEGEEDREKDLKSRPLLNRKNSISSSSSPSPSAPMSASRMIPAIPMPQSIQEREYMNSQSKPSRKFHHSAPMNVPVLSQAMKSRKSNNFEEVDFDEDDDEEMLPPHEIVARGRSNRSPKTTFSVLEGVGRTLKGRDLRQVRNAVWRKTGFLD